MKPKPHKKGGSNGRKSKSKGGYNAKVAAYLAACEIQRELTPEEANAERARLWNGLSKAEKAYADACLESLYYNGDCG